MGTQGDAPRRAASLHDIDLPAAEIDADAKSGQKSFYVEISCASNSRRRRESESRRWMRWSRGRG